MAENNEYGKWGEQMAVDHLVSEGCAIMHRNWRSGHYEVDIIAQKGNRIIFVEVKTRRLNEDDSFTAFDKGKQRRLLLSANNYLRLFRPPYGYQFDFITVTGDPHDFKLNHYEDIRINNIRTYR